MKKIILFIVGFCIVTLCQAAWPTKEITLVVPFPPGGATDQLARAMVPDLEKKLKVPVVIQNKPGANNAVAINYILSRNNDDHTFLFTNGEYTPGIIFQGHTTYKHFKAVTITSTVPFLLFGTNTTNVAKFKQQIKSQKSIDVAIVGIYSSANLWITNLPDNLKINSINYKGTPPVMSDVIAGHVEYGLMSISGSANFVQQGQLTAIMVSSDRRVPQAPTVPTFRELGLKGESSENWFGVLTRRSTSDEAISKFTSAVRSTVETNVEVREFTNKGMTLINLDTAQSAKFIEKDIMRYEQLYQKVGQVKAD